MITPWGGRYWVYLSGTYLPDSCLVASLALDSSQVCSRGPPDLPYSAGWSRLSTLSYLHWVGGHTSKNTDSLLCVPPFAEVVDTSVLLAQGLGSNCLGPPLPGQ